MNTKITVLTPTIATDTLANAVRSVAKQKVAHDIDLRHIIVADGKRYENAARDIALKSWEGIGNTPKVYAVPDNTGANGWNGHKIYAYYAQLLDTDYLCLLDEDNTFEPDHVASLLPIAERHGMAWSLRTVYTKGGERLGVDRAESIGKWVQPENGMPYILVDTSCWMLARHRVQYLSHFLEPWSGDRRFTRHMTNISADLQPMASGLPTMNYYAPDHLRGFFKHICTEQ
jgi:hypothetical protein